MRSMSKNSPPDVATTRAANFAELEPRYTADEAVAESSRCLFCYDAPSYLRLPRVVRGKWPQYARSVRSLCVAAIEKRKTYRFYLRWLEAEIKQLARGPLRKSRDEKQLPLLFDG